MMPASSGPFFLITIDTEGDNLWGRQRAVTTRNAQYLGRFQALCESYGLRPTYLVDYEMAADSVFVQFGRDLLRRNTGEIGMHLHAWHSPPDYPLTHDDWACHPYLTEYPHDVMRAKVGHMTRLLEDMFGVKVVSHRGGRWALDEAYAQILMEHGYLVDTTVVPRVSRRHMRGAPQGQGGPDYRAFPADAYFLDPEAIHRPGHSKLLEIPMTVVPCRSAVGNWIRDVFPWRSLPWRVLDKIWPSARWLRPNGRNLKSMLEIVENGTRASGDYIQMMLHSSELMPGGSPTFPTAESIETLYRHLEAVFVAAKPYRGATLKEYRDLYRSARRPIERRRT